MESSTFARANAIFIPWFLAAFLTLITGCSSLHKIIRSLPDNKEIFIPTYDGANQVVHPDILFTDHKFYLAITPYPVGNNKCENPSIYESRDGCRFEELSSGINPLVKSPDKGFNCDPDLVYDKKTNTFYLFYLDAVYGMYAHLKCVRWSDICHDTILELMKFDLLKNQTRVGSPAFVKARNDSIYMLFVNSTDNSYNYFIEYFRTKDVLKWDSNSRKRITIDFPENFRPWHMDVTYSRQHRKYYMICTGFLFDPVKVNTDNDPKYRRYENILAVSRDLKSWKVLDYFLRPEDLDKSYNTDFVYRSSGIVSRNIFMVWYSFRDKNLRWHLGIKKYWLDRRGNLDGKIHFRHLYKDQPPAVAQGSAGRNSVAGNPTGSLRIRNALAEIEKLNREIDDLKVDTCLKAHQMRMLGVINHSLTLKNKLLSDSIHGQKVKWPVNPEHKPQTDLPDERPKEAENPGFQADISRKIQHSFQTCDTNLVNVGSRNNQLKIVLVDTLIFEKGSENFLSGMIDYCGILIEMLRINPDKKLVIVAHSETASMNDELYRNTHDLAKARINNLVRLLTVKFSVDPSRLEGISRSDVNPNNPDGGNTDTSGKSCFEFRLIPGNSVYL